MASNTSVKEGTPLEHNMCVQVFAGDLPSLEQKGLPETNTEPKPDLPKGVFPFILDREWKWPSDTKEITVKFIEPGTPKVQANIKKMAAKWSDYCGITFKFLDPSAPSADVRISFTAPGSWSYVGTCCHAIDKSKATMNFSWFNDTTSDEEFERVTVHEFGHALGAVHEQFNPVFPFHWKEAAVIAYHKAHDDWTEQVVRDNYNNFKNIDATKVEHTVWDKDSIMHYPIPAAFVVENKDVSAGGKSMSAMDKSFIATMYPKK